MNSYKRRNFLKTLIIAPSLATSCSPLTQSSLTAQPGIPPVAGNKLKLSLNAYSFNEPLRNGTVSIDDLLNFCAANNFDAVDLTGYYLPGYPAVPSDSYLYDVKYKAFKLGLEFSGTGIRNDFSTPDASKRKEDIILIKHWIDVAAKLGAPVLRIFSGNNLPSGYTWEQVADWMVKDIKECVAYAETKGVIVAVQNHFDFIKTAEEAEKIINAVNSKWFGLVLDIGSYRGPNPYRDIEQTAKYAVNWQLKENMYFDNVETKTDVKKVIELIKASGYRGYIPIETLGAGDPKTKVPVFLAEVRDALQKNGL